MKVCVSKLLMFHKFFSIPLLVGFLFTVAFSFLQINLFLFAQEVDEKKNKDVQFVARGLSCRPNFGNCEEKGYRSLAKGDGISFAGDKDYTSVFLQKMEAVYGEHFVNLCYDPKHFNPELIPYRAISEDPFKQIEVVTDATITNIDVIARMCPRASHVQNALRVDLIPAVSIQGEAGQTGNWVSWGCCPAGYVGATGSGSNAGATQSLFACCLAEGYDLNNGRINLKRGSEVGVGGFASLFENFCVLLP